MKNYQVKESGDDEWQEIQADSHKEAVTKIYGKVKFWKVLDWNGNGKECYNFSSIDKKHMYWVLLNN